MLTTMGTAFANLKIQIEQIFSGEMTNIPTFNQLSIQ
jgi:hypothetical protein